MRPILAKSLKVALSALTSTRRHRGPFLKVSPSRVLALRVRQNGLRPSPRRYERLFPPMALMTNERLPVMTFQQLLRNQDLSNEPELAAIVARTDPRVWQDRLNGLASRGHSEQDLEHWAWILSGETPDARIHRFASTDTEKPVFLMDILLQVSQPIKHVESLSLMLKYISDTYFPKQSTKSVRRPMDDMRFLTLLNRLIRHVQRVSPRLIVTLAAFARSYILDLPYTSTAEHRVRLRQYHRRCRIFNTALRLFSTPAPNQPVLNMEFNWRAQRILLAMSDSLERPLVIARQSYQAIRKVMIAQPKSATERWRAARQMKSWPPFRQDFDGHDAARTPEDDQSRSVRAGALMREAGYEADDYDQALDALGGTAQGLPTIQTRSLAPKQWRDEKSYKNFYTSWAMQVRATRNAWEAWRQFNSFTDIDKARPNLQVYTEMFFKLSARQADHGPDALPGDAREVYPVHEGNLSQYELARLAPPTVEELYERMRSEGIKPEGICLQYLISNAPSLEHGERYLRDGIDDEEAIQILTHARGRIDYNALRRIPLVLFSSWIQLLCRLQPNRRGEERVHPYTLSSVRRAIKLTQTRLPPKTREGEFFRPPWHHIFRTLARPHVAVVNGPELLNSSTILSLFIAVYEAAKNAIGVDPEMFLYMCHTIQKLVEGYLVRGEKLGYSPHPDAIPYLIQSRDPLGVHMSAARDTVLQALELLLRDAESAPAPGEDWEGPSTAAPLPAARHFLGSQHLHAGMRTLAFLGDRDGMVMLLEWMLRHREYVSREGARVSRGRAMVAKTLCAFEAFAGPALSRETRARLDKMMEAGGGATPENAWRWPEAAEVLDYIASDTRMAASVLYIDPQGGRPPRDPEGDLEPETNSPIRKVASG